MNIKIRLKKSKSGQAFIEFCMCVPIVIMLLFGLFDICKMNVLRVELQGFAQQAINIYSTNDSDSQNPSLLLSKTKEAMAKSSTFCIKGRPEGNCADPLVVKFKLGIKSSGGTWKAGDIACVRGEIEYTPFYKAILKNGKTTLNATACSSIEHNGAVPTSGDVYIIK